MKIFVVSHRAFLALAVCGAIGVGGMTLAQHTGKDEVEVTQLSQRDIIEKLDGKEASATVLEVTFEPGQKDSSHRHVGPVLATSWRANTSTPSTTSRSRPTRDSPRRQKRPDSFIQVS